MPLTLKTVPIYNVVSIGSDTPLGEKFLAIEAVDAKELQEDIAVLEAENVVLEFLRAENADLHDLLKDQKKKTLQAHECAQGFGVHALALRQVITDFIETMKKQRFHGTAALLEERLLGVEEQENIAGLFKVLLPIAQELQTQDNAITADPIFVVEQRDRIYGLDTAWGGDQCLLDEDYNELTDADLVEYREVYKDELAAFAEEEGLEVDDDDFMYHFLTQTDGKGCCRFNVTWTGYQDRWSFVTPCFTRAAAEAYIERNGHNLKHPRVYVHSGYRNREWIDLRKAIAALMPVSK